MRGTANNAVGRIVLVPADLWPHYTCDEHDGLGWEAEVRSASSVTALVRFLHA